MKTLSKSVFNAEASLCLAMMALLMGSGCAGDRYNRSTGEYIDDHSLQLRVDHALNSSPDYKFPDVSVVTYKGVIQLNGFVDLADQKARAGEIVKQIQGVREVDNNITVEAKTSRTEGEVIDDRALVKRVRDALHSNPEYKFDDVTVAAYKGMVQLGGFVNAADQKGKAGDIAKNVSGTKDVQNNITAKDKLNP